MKQKNSDNLNSGWFSKNWGNLCLLSAVVAGLYLFASPYFQKEHSGGSDSGGSNFNHVSLTTDAGSILATTMPIEKIVVGQRVLAKNPEVSQQERSSWKEPEWENWVKLSLVMPKPDGSELKVEMLRPESWVLDQVRYHLAEKAEPSDESLPKQPPTSEGLPSAIESQQHSKKQTEFVSLKAEDSNPGNIAEPTNGQLVRIEPSLVPLSPLRPVYRELLITSYYLQQKADESGAELAGLAIQMDLPELGLTGNAVLTNIEPAPQIKPGTGRVVTATFHHSSGDVIDLTVGSSNTSSDTETIGTTSNHPFWSVDRQKYVQAGELKIGETLKSFKNSGDQKVVIGQMPRPGPTPVYNLEVHGEHVYYVGQNGILVHNTYSRGEQLRQKYAHLSPTQRRARISELQANAELRRNGVMIDTGIMRNFVGEGSNMRHIQKMAVGDRNMIATETAISEFRDAMIKTGSLQEKLRANRLLQRIKSVPDNPSAAFPASLASKRMGAEDLSIFGTADSIGVEILSTDRTFMRTYFRRTGQPINGQWFAPYVRK